MVDLFYSLSGLADSFYDDIKSLPLEDGAGGPETPFLDSDGGDRKFKRRKVYHFYTSSI